jgi:RND family efflux transporter MFP subunit
MKPETKNRPQIRNNAGMGKLVILIVVVGIILAVLLVVGILPRIGRKQELDKMHEETTGAVPVVRTIVADPAKESESIVLPANIGAIQYTTIYARVDGYLKSRLVDIGDHVKNGQLLAVIDTPTIDQQLEQGRADLMRAKATLETNIADNKEAIAQELTAEANLVKAKTNFDYASITASRWQNLCARGAVSQQSRDEKVRFLDTTNAEVRSNQADVQAAKAKVVASVSKIAEAKAEVRAKDAEVKKLVAEQGFQKVTAPFEGVITERKVDAGALITQGSQTTALELFQLAKIDRLRIYVSVPQRIARYMHTGVLADVIVPEFPERKFIGKVTNTSGGLDPSTRTRQTEIQIDNADHALLPGMYAEIKLSGARDGNWIKVPGTTIVTRPNGQYVIVVKDGKAVYKAVTIGRDYGDAVEIRVGLNDGDHVVISPNDELRDGEAVQEKPFVDENPILNPLQVKSPAPADTGH